MTFTNKDFTDLLNFCKNKNNFHKKAKIPYDCIYNISESDNKNTSLINDMKFWLYNFDNLCFNINIRDNGKIKGNLPASTDGLYYKNKILYFIEFKGLPLYSPDYKKELKNIRFKLMNNKCNNLNENCPIDEKIIRKLDEIYYRYEDEILCKLKIKHNESLFFVLPEIYKYYCNKNRINYDEKIDEFISWLLHTKKRFIVVFSDNNESNPSNMHFSFYSKLRNKYSHFENISNISTSIINQNEFKNKYLYKYFDEIKLPPCITMNYIDQLENGNY